MEIEGGDVRLQSRTVAMGKGQIWTEKFFRAVVVVSQ